MHAITMPERARLNYPIEGINWYLSDFFTVSAT